MDDTHDARASLVDDAQHPAGLAAGLEDAARKAKKRGRPKSVGPAGAREAAEPIQPPAEPLDPLTERDAGLLIRLGFRAAGFWFGHPHWKQAGDACSQEVAPEVAYLWNKYLLPLGLKPDVIVAGSIVESVTEHAGLAYAKTRALRELEAREHAEAERSRNGHGRP